MGREQGQRPIRKGYMILAYDFLVFNSHLEASFRMVAADALIMRNIKRPEDRQTNGHAKQINKRGS